MGKSKEELQKQIDYLEEERKLLWKKTTELTKRVEELTTTLKSDLASVGNEVERLVEANPRTVSAQLSKATEARNKAEARLADIEEFATRAKHFADAAITNNRTLAEQRERAVAARIELEENIEAASVNLSSLEEKIELIEGVQERHPDLAEELTELEESLQTSREGRSKMDQLLRAATTAKASIDEVTQSILGFDQEDEDGEMQRIPGRVEELEESLDGFDERVSEAQKQAATAQKQISASINTMTESMDAATTKAINAREEELKRLIDKIEGLLPGAMTAGLSKAYHDKAATEIEERKSHTWSFRIGVILLAIVSLIPFGVGWSFLARELPLEDVVLRLPRIVLTILPIYIPIFWFTSAAAKRVKLSKRLIEEYGYKESLGLTFEGLSREIAGLGDDPISAQLKANLLRNMVDVSASNPGALIGDYGYSDHPLFEFLQSRSRDRTGGSKDSSRKSSKPISIPQRSNDDSKVID